MLQEIKKAARERERDRGRERKREREWGWRERERGRDDNKAICSPPLFFPDTYCQRGKHIFAFCLQL
jgi:hypothetical protein